MYHSMNGMIKWIYKRIYVCVGYLHYVHAYIRLSLSQCDFIEIFLRPMFMCNSNFLAAKVDKTGQYGN